MKNGAARHKNNIKTKNVEKQYKEKIQKHYTPEEPVLAPHYPQNLLISPPG